MLCVNHPSDLFSSKKGYSCFPLTKVLPARNEGCAGSRYRYICFWFFLKQADVTVKEMCFDAVLSPDISFEICYDRINSVILFFFRYMFQIRSHMFLPATSPSSVMAIDLIKRGHSGFCHVFFLPGCSIIFTAHAICCSRILFWYALYFGE